MSADAKGGFALINTGDDLFEVADLPAAILKDFSSAKDAKAGYKCSRFGLFWADIETWDCQLVAVTGENSYGTLPHEVVSKLEADSQHKLSNAVRDFWNHYAF